MKIIPLNALPATLRDAIVATRQLGYRFLWVDSLCIVQDDKDDWSKEVKQMKSIYANATVVLSAYESEDTSGGLFLPRQERPVTPVQLSLRFHKQYRSHTTHKFYHFVLLVLGEKRLFGCGPINSRAWALQEQALCTRVLHFGPGVLFWDCFDQHGSEADPEGDTHPSRSSCTDFMDVRSQKRAIHERLYSSEMERMHDYVDESKGEDEEETFIQPDKSDDDEEVEEDQKKEEGDDGDEDADEEDEEDEDWEEEEEETPGEQTVVRKLGTRFSKKNDPKTPVYVEWQEFVSKYTSRKVTKPTDRVPGFLGLSTLVAEKIQDELIAGIWKNDFFLPSLLWAATAPGGQSRNQNYPS